MSETVTIARPYAQAVFRLARESSSLPLWSDRLQRLALIAQDADMASVMDNPKFSAAQLAELFLSLSGEGADQSLGSFIGLLAENERLTILPCIRELYEQLRSADEGIRDAQITSAFALDEQQLDNLTSQLEAHFGSRLRPHVEVDATLIGGVRVAVGDQFLDLSVRGKLETMATALKN
jgi:F-type H+-transporting ATPase subunit delta